MRTSIKKLFVVSLISITAAGVIFSNNNFSNPIPVSAQDAFDLNFGAGQNDATTRLATNSNATTTEVLTFLNSSLVSPGVTPVSSVSVATTVRGSNNPLGLEVGLNNTRGQLTFSLNNGFEFSGFTLNGRFFNSPGEITMIITGTYKPITGFTTPSEVTRSVVMTTDFANYSIDLSNPGTPHVIQTISLAPSGTGTQNTNFILGSMTNVDTSGTTALNFEQKVLTFSPCVNANDGLTDLDLATATALRNEYLALGPNTKAKFNRTQNDPNGAYQRYLFICQKYNLNPFSA